MKEEKESKKREQELIKDLESRNERRIIGALQLIPHDGTPAMIKPMFELYGQNPSKEILMLLEKSLFNLKDQNCQVPMIEILRDSEKTQLHIAVLSAIWHSGIDVSEELALLVDLAGKGDFETVLEVITVIENLEFDDDMVLTQAISTMDELIDRASETSALLGSLRQLLLSKLLGES